MTQPHIDNQVLGEITFGQYKAERTDAFQGGVKFEQARIIKSLWEWATSDDPKPAGFKTFEELETFIKGEAKRLT